MNPHAYFYHSYNLRYNSFCEPHLTELNLLMKINVKESSSRILDFVYFITGTCRCAISGTALERFKELLVDTICVSVDRITCRMRTLTEGGGRKRSSISILGMVK